jgi:hypothetical protein
MSLQEFASSFSSSRSHADRFRFLERSLLRPDAVDSGRPTLTTPGEVHTTTVIQTGDYSLDDIDAEQGVDTVESVDPFGATKLVVTSTLVTPAAPPKPMKRIALALCFIGCGTCWGATPTFINKSA